MYFVLFLDLFFSSSAQIFSKSGELIWLPIELRKVATVSIQFNVTLSFHNWVKIFFNFRALESWNITSHYIIWDISKRNIISNSETLMDSILFFICKFIKHAWHVWNFIMIWYFASFRVLIWFIVKFCFEHIVFFINGI